jgi:hypothetical protein
MQPRDLITITSEAGSVTGIFQAAVRSRQFVLFINNKTPQRCGEGGRGEAAKPGSMRLPCHCRQHLQNIMVKQSQRAGCAAAAAAAAAAARLTSRDNGGVGPLFWAIRRVLEAAAAPPHQQQQQQQQQATGEIDNSTIRIQDQQWPFINQPASNLSSSPFSSPAVGWLSVSAVLCPNVRTARASFNCTCQ